MTSNELDRLLDQAADRAQGALRSKATGEAVAFAARAGVFLLCIVPAASVVLALFGAAPPMWVVLAGAVAPFLLFVAFFAIKASAKTFRRDEALGLADDQLGLSDRLVTAHSFLQSDSRTPFMEAAVWDAQEPAKLAATATLEDEAETEAWTSKDWGMLWAAGILCATGLMVAPGGSADIDAIADEQTAEAEPEDKDAESKTLRPPVRPKSVTPALLRTDDRPRPPITEKKRPQAKGAEAKASPKAEDLSDDVKEAAGLSGAGRSAEATSASGKSRSQGTPSNQGQASKSSKKKTGDKKKKDASAKKAKPPEESERKEEEDSGATAGRGASTGSNKSPSASPWSSKDQVVSEEEEDIEDDEEIDDEFDNSEARGGVQPGLRDRRPPVNRDLTIGFGNRKSPDANGRGGPSEQKKSRGVATLVLGVPIPDHVKGKPNPGKTKITQERVQPQAERAERESARERPQRIAPSGHLARPDLMPWMQGIVREYFLSLRTQDQKDS